ncbi:hypothetical protein DP43_5419 [Burkholderia pseudomallei]|nr:hypothetical protein DP43_5419 [Burkholderia pseudomallei]
MRGFAARRPRRSWPDGQRGDFLPAANGIGFPGRLQ